jgi:alkylation response protein AidB-like acyl-CoA dehydrogenase
MKSMGFMKGLFEGEILSEKVVPYPGDCFSSEFKTMVEAVSQFVQSLDSQKMDENHQLDPTVLEDMRRLGLFGLIIPVEYGGLGLGQAQYCRIIEELARYDASVSITVGAHLSIGLKGLLMAGTEAQKETYLPRLATGEMLAAFALTEPGSGSDAASLRTAAKKVSGGFELKGEKIWITNGGLADFFTVFALTPEFGQGAVSAFIVERSMDGVSTGRPENKMGLCASSTTSLAFDRVFVPEENLLGEPGSGFKLAMRILNQGRLGIAAGSLGAIKRAIFLATEHALERHQFQKPLFSFEVIREKMMNMHADLFGAEAAVYTTAVMIDRGEKDYSLETAAAKVLASEKAWRHMNEALQIAGGAGFMREYPYERMVRDLRINMIFEGTNEILKLYTGSAGAKHVSEQTHAGGPISSVTAQDLERLFTQLRSMAPDMGEPGNSGLQVEPGLEEETAAWLTVFHTRTRDLAIATRAVIQKVGPEIREAECLSTHLAEMAGELYMFACAVSRASRLLSGGPHSPGPQGSVADWVKACMAVLTRQVNRNTAFHLRSMAHNDYDLMAALFDSGHMDAGYPILG